MPPIVALFLCAIFVFFLLWVEHKQKSEVSFTSWIPTIWMLVIASKPLGRWFGTVGGDLESGSFLDRAFLTCLFFLGVIVLAKRRFDFTKAMRENIWLILLVAYMLLSILWSDIQYVSFKRWTKEAVAVIMAFLVLTEKNPPKALEVILRRTIYILIPFSYILIHYYPEYGRAYHRWSGELMWVGMTLQKNCLGRLCMISVFFIVWDLIRRWQERSLSFVKYQIYGDVIVLLISLKLLVGPSIRAMSASGTISLFLGLMFLFVLLGINKRKLHVVSEMLRVLIAAIIIFGTIAVFTGGSNVAFLSSSVGRDQTLTGRTEIWNGLIPDAMERFVTGYGVGGFWTDLASSKHRYNEAHNGYLEIILQYGFFGLMIFTIYLISFCRKAQKVMTQDFAWGTLCICFLLMAVVHNIAESSIDSFASHLTAVVMFLSVVCASSPFAHSKASRPV